MTDKKKGGIELYSPTYFAMCGIGGILSCGITHTAVTPLDLVKCNIQANPKEFKGTFQGMRLIWSGQAAQYGYASGFKGITTGWAPTMVGYSIQGLCKFGFYEIFKHYYSEPFGQEWAFKLRDLIYIAASASAEFIADVGLCPFEAVKVRVQTNPKYASGLLDGLPKMISQEGMGNLFAGIGPLWARQVPYTIIKFLAFERIAEVLYAWYPKAKSEMTPVEDMAIIFESGYIAGVICGAVSHPADTLVSKINKLKMEGGIMQKSAHIYKEIGFWGLWKGFWPRVVMIGTLTGLQWFIYGAFKGAAGLPTPGASASDKK